ncbi:hypothetical protein ACOMCU_01620 [Lysinibacillus sp. UGB7]|uniref:hypothetical protein n=1 Tax=Lysinibacillus sp. UGB7 TaxID=3411039 RepID=UPI003B81C44A
MTTLLKEYATEVIPVDLPKEFRDLLDQMITDSKRECPQQLIAQAFLQGEYAKVRRSFELDCIVSFVTVAEDDEVYVLVFRTVKTHDQMYEVFYDEEKNRHFINVSTVECKTCGGSGFSGHGSGYDSVCDNCGGKGEHPRY